MPATVIGFFSPTDILGLGGYFIVQSVTPSVTQQRAQGALGNGDEGVNKVFGSRTDLVVVYEYQHETGNIALPRVGQIKATYHIDRVRLQYRSNAWPLITITCHKHAVATHIDCNTFATSVTLPAQFGIPRSLNVWALGANDAGIGIKDMTLDLSCVHQDEDGESGAHLWGENRDGLEKLDIALVGIPASSTITNTWSTLNDGTALNNTAADTQTLSYEHHVLRY